MANRAVVARAAADQATVDLVAVVLVAVVLAVVDQVVAVPAAVAAVAEADTVIGARSQPVARSLTKSLGDWLPRRASAVLRGARPAAGTVALVFFVIHGGTQVLEGRPGNLLWACHAGMLLMSMSLLVGWPRGNAVGTMVLLGGLPLWAMSLVAGGEFIPTSVLTHIGGPLLGLWGVRKLGLPVDSWLGVVLFIAGLMLASRAFTPPELNVNLAYRTWAPAADLFPTQLARVLSGLGYWALVSWPLERLLRLWPAPAEFTA